MENVYCKPYDIRIDTHLPDGTPHFNIRFWCHNRNSEPVLVRVEDFTSFIRVELPVVVGGKVYKWTNEKVEKVNDWLKFSLKDHAPILFLQKSYYKLYYYQNKTPFMVLFFESEEAQRHCVNFLKSPRVIKFLSEENQAFEFKCWEHEVNCVRKLLTLKKQKYTQWMSFQASKIVNDEDRISKPGNPKRPLSEYLVSWKKINPVSIEESKSWLVHPRIFAYDFEVYSDNHKVFPDSFKIKHCIYNISLIGIDDKDEDSKVKYSLLYGKSPPPKDAIHIETNSEKELLTKFEETIEEYDPDILTGYNIFGFDNEYYGNRKKIICDNEIHNFTRLKNGEVKVETKKWKSSGFGHNIITIIDAEGRISIDMLPIIKREYRLSMYTLSFVSREFLKEDKHDVTPAEMFRAHEVNIKAMKILQKKPDSHSALKKLEKMKRVLEYCLQDSELVIKLFNKMNTWISLVEMSAVVGVTVVELFTRGQQVRTFSLLFDLAYNRDFVITKRDFPVIPYSGAFVFTPLIGIHDNVLCEDFAALYPSIMIAHNLCYSTLRPPHLTDPDENFIKISFYQENGIKCKEDENDLNDLAEMEDVDNKNIDSDEDNNDSDQEIDEKVISIEKDEDDEDLDPDKEYTFYTFMWAKPSLRKGLMPQMMENLINERNSVKAQLKQIEKELDEIDDTEKEKIELLNTLKIILDKRQLALKITANSGYGFLGAQTSGILPFIEAAMNITHLGKRFIRRCVRYLVTTYNAKIIYGDTDSVMFIIPGVEGKDCDEWGKRLAKELTSLFPPPLKLEFEKAMRMISFTKKRYASYLIKSNGEYVTEHEMKKNGCLLPYILVRGIIIARRDNCSWLRDTYTELLRCILDKKDILCGYSIIIKNVMDLLYGNINPPKELSVVKTLNAQYKSESCQMKVFGDKLNSIGKPVKPGERLSYLVLKDENDGTSKALRLGDKMILTEDYNPDEHPIDMVYYLDRLLKKPIDQLFSVGYSEDLETDIGCFGYSPEYCRKKPKFVTTPIEMISLMLQDNFRGKVEESKTIKKISRLSAAFKKYVQSI